MNYLKYFSITGLINFTGILILAFFVLFKNPRSKVNIRFFIFNLTVAGWAFGYIFWPLAKNAQEVLFWFRVLHASSTFISITFFHFVISLLNLKKPKLLKLGYLASLIIFPFVFTPYFIEKMVPIGTFPYWGVAGPAYYAFVINFLGFGLLSMFFLFKSYRETSDLKKRNQLKYILAATAAGYICGSTNFPQFFGIPFPPYLNGLTIIYVALFVYAIVAHKLLDINIIFRKTLIYSILATIITLLYFGIVLFVENVFRVYYGYKSFFLSFLVITFFLLLLQPLKNIVQRFLDKYFFHGTIEQIDEENIKLREEIQKSEKMKAIATLAAGMAHEIKNPLTSIKTFTEYIDQKQDNPEFLNKFKQIVGDEVDKINFIVKQLLEFSKPVELKLQDTNVNDLLDQTLDLLNNEFLKRNIQINKSYSNLLDTKVDPSQIKQVFLNISLNAIDSMKNGGILNVVTKNNQDKISITVKDTGTGIKKEDLKHIFDPFFSKKDEGTGLGLSVVHGIIEKHNGNIKANSTVGEGTTFEIILPLN